MMNKLKNKKIIFGVVIILIIVLMTRGNGNKPKNVDLYTVVKREVVKNVNATGKTVSKRDFIYKAPVSAKIAQIYVNSGDSVNKGDKILSFDENSVKSSAQSAWSSYLTAKNSVDNFDATLSAANQAVRDTKFKRDKAQEAKNEDDNDTNKQLLRTAEYNYQTAVANYETLKGSKESLVETQNSAYSSYLAAKNNLNNLYAIASAKGLVALESLTEGDVVTAGQKLFSLNNTDTIEFNAEVDESDIDSITIGQKVTVTIDGFPNDTFEGTVSRIDAKTRVTSTSSTIVDVIVALSLGEHKPIVGLSGSVEIEVGKEDQKLALPFDTILFTNDNKYYVFVVQDNNAVHRVVEVGFEGDDAYVVKTGVNENDVVVTGNAVTELSDGSTITFNKTK